MKLSAMYVVLLLMLCFSANTQLALPETTEPNANEAVLSALMTQQLLEDSKSILKKCVNCVGKCLNCVASKIKDLIWKNAEEPVEKKFTDAIEAHATRKKIFNEDFAIMETTMNRKTYLIIALQYDSQLSNLKIEKNEDLGVSLYKEMNDVFKDGILNNSLQKIIVEKLYKNWANMTEAKRSTAQLLITGHSIGGGFAQILGTYLKSETKNLLSHLKLKESDESTFAEMLKKTKVYTFSTPFVFLKKLKDEVPSDWKPLQQDSYNFMSTTDTVKVASKTFLRKVWDHFAWFIKKFSLVLFNGSTVLFTASTVAGIIIQSASIAIIGGLFASCITAMIYSIFLGFEQLFQVVKNFFSKVDPNPILYDSHETNPHFMLVDQNSLEEQTKLNKHSMRIDDHIKIFFSNADFVQLKALPAPDQKEETADENLVKEETFAVVQKEVETLVAVDGNKPEPSPIANEPSNFLQLGIIGAFILSVFHL